MRAEFVRLGQRGAITLPRNLRAKYGLEEGHQLSLVDLDGVLLLSPKLSVVPNLTAEIERVGREGGVTVDDLLTGLPRPSARGLSR
jgi:bifunctional DNA-binding transcriptional regulator/antitoxin component of YhaV-PrlF toxin-antitoxin module